METVNSLNLTWDLKAVTSKLTKLEHTQVVYMNDIHVAKSSSVSTYSLYK